MRKATRTEVRREFKKYIKANNIEVSMTDDCLNEVRQALESILGKEIHLNDILIVVGEMC